MHHTTELSDSQISDYLTIGEQKAINSSWLGRPNHYPLVRSQSCISDFLGLHDASFDGIADLTG
jgi:hypothetical protein